MTTTNLRPVSFHLRNFGQYISLDLEAATDGNLTLLGANAAGKTTLANAFYPLLIDGSIATPNFNPARSSDAVAQSSDPRNTTRDKRTFNSMLLGWGKAKFAVRTGYTYMELRSASRQVVLGIGAHRQTDGYKSATWWFVLESKDVSGLVCCDEKGSSLDKDNFEDANAGFGAELQVFNQWQTYRNFVAVNIYGFDGGEALGKLANAYRLLASPILTGGNARFAPIPNALRMAQEPIDQAQIIEPLAFSQRHLNQTLARQKALENALERLQTIKRALFWGNLNHLNDQDGLLPQHVNLAAKQNAASTAIIRAQAEVERFSKQLQLAQAVLTEAEAKLADLQARLAEQNTLKQLRANFDRQIADLHKRLERFNRQQAERQEDEALVAKRQKAVSTLLEAAKALRADQLEPLVAQLHGQSASLVELAQALAETTDERMLASLQDYVANMRRDLKEYEHLAASITRSSGDVALVVGMQGQMGTAIDTRLSGRLHTGVHDDLSADNRQIHEAGAAKMNAQVAELQSRQHDLLDHAPDLATYVKDGKRLEQLQEEVAQLKAVLSKLTINQNKQVLADERLKAAEDQLAKLIAAIDPDFDPASASAQIEKLTAQRDELQLDPTLSKRVKVQQEKINQYRTEGNELQRQLGEQKGIISTQTEQMKQIEAEKAAVDERLEAALSTLRQFAPEDAELTDIPAALAYVRSNRATIRSHPFSQLGSIVRTAVAGGEHAEPLDQLFAAQDAPELAAGLHEARTIVENELLVVPFNLAKAIALFEADVKDLARAVAERENGQSLALQTYLNAAAIHISQQYQLIPTYNEMLSEGIDPDGIRLEVALEPLPGSTEKAVTEACDLTLTERPALASLVQNLIDQLVKNPDLASDEEAFIDEAARLLDTRMWSEFKIYIYRRHSDERELVNDAFVQSGGSGAEKAQAMVLPLLLVPKMQLRQAQKPDAPYLVMFDEFADKLDPETARAFAQTIDRFGFNFIATMPSGAQTKILADGVANRAYEVLAPRRTDGRFHANQVHEVMQWHAPNEEEAND